MAAARQCTVSAAILGDRVRQKVREEQQYATVVEHSQITWPRIAGCQPACAAFAKGRERPISNRPQVDNLPHMAASRNRIFAPAAHNG